MKVSIRKKMSFHWAERKERFRQKKCLYERSNCWKYRGFVAVFNIVKYCSLCLSLVLGLSSSIHIILIKAYSSIPHCISLVTNLCSWKRFPGIEPSQLFTEFWPTEWLVSSPRFCELLLWHYLSASFISCNESMYISGVFIFLCQLPTK